MTIVVWDGKTLAADKQSTSQGLQRSATKIFREGDLLIAGCGSVPAVLEMKAWFLGGAKPEDFPDRWRTKDPDDAPADLLVVSRDGRCLRFEGSPYPIPVQEPYFAMGCGRAFAYGALLMGADSVRAVEIASELDAFCGNGVDTLAFD
jgi:hypothetical protein